jgi:cysteine desulfurase
MDGQLKKLLRNARKEIALLVNADPREIVWTSGATESNNLAIKGASNFYSKKGKHIITLATEHKAVIDAVRECERIGYEATYMEPEPNGLLDIRKIQINDTPRYRSSFCDVGE